MSNSTTVSNSPVVHQVSAANDAVSVPPGTTIGDLIAALQDAADECTEDQDHADMLVCASLVELRNQFTELVHEAKSASDRAA